MFGRTTNDLSEFLMRAEDEARVRCRHDREAMARTMASWLEQDRRFDGMDRLKLAKEAMDARSHGRILNLTEPVTSGAMSMPGYAVRNV